MTLNIDVTRAQENKMAIHPCWAAVFPYQVCGSRLGFFSVSLKHHLLLQPSLTHGLQIPFAQGGGTFGSPSGNNVHVPMNCIYTYHPYGRLLQMFGHKSPASGQLPFNGKRLHFLWETFAVGLLHTEPQLQNT